MTDSELKFVAPDSESRIIGVPDGAPGCLMFAGSNGSSVRISLDDLTVMVEGIKDEATLVFWQAIKDSFPRKQPQLVVTDAFLEAGCLRVTLEEVLCIPSKVPLADVIEQRLRNPKERESTATTNAEDVDLCPMVVDEWVKRCAEILGSDVNPASVVVYAQNLIDENARQRKMIAQLRQTKT